MPDVYSWDTSVILAWFQGEESKPLDDIELVFREIESERAQLVVSITTYSEVLAVGDSEPAAETYRKFLERSNVLQVNVDPPVAQKAAEIREACKNNGIRCPTVGDAQIIATAVLYGANVLHTFDKGMLRLSERPFVGGLRIEKPAPISGQRNLFTVVDGETTPSNSSLDPHMIHMLFGRRRSAGLQWGKRTDCLASAAR